MLTVYLILSAVAGAGGMAAAVRWMPSVAARIVRPTGGGGPRPVVPK